MFMSEKKLAVEVGQIDRVEVDNVNLAEAVEHEVFQKLASDASSAHHEHSRLRFGSVSTNCICDRENRNRSQSDCKEGEGF
jgi:hypothetical protein